MPTSKYGSHQSALLHKWHTYYSIDVTVTEHESIEYRLQLNCCNKCKCLFTLTKHNQLIISVIEREKLWHLHNLLLIVVTHFLNVYNDTDFMLQIKLLVSRHLYNNYTRQSAINYRMNQNHQSWLHFEISGMSYVTNDRPSSREKEGSPEATNMQICCRMRNAQCCL